MKRKKKEFVVSINLNNTNNQYLCLNDKCLCVLLTKCWDSFYVRKKNPKRVNRTNNLKMYRVQFVPAFKE